MAAVSIPWEYVSDGRTKEGSNFQPNMEALLNDGMTLEFKLNDGGTQKFTSAADFRDWFEKIAS